MYAVKQYVNGRGIQDAQEMVTEVMKNEAKMANMYSGRTTAFSGVAGFLGSTPYTKQLSLPASMQLQFLHNIRDRSVSSEVLRFRLVVPLANVSTSTCGKFP